MMAVGCLGMGNKAVRVFRPTWVLGFPEIFPVDGKGMGEVFLLFFFFPGLSLAF